jgi:succinyldiaminopimelate transaminase
MICGAKVVTYRTASDVPSDADLIWVNSPSNPSGEVLGVDELAAIVEVGRKIGAPVVGDECYFELGWTADPVSVLDPRVCGVTQDGVLAVHSLSKRSNLAGYRSGAVLGDTALVQAIIGARKHSGMLLPSPIQQATIAALDDAEHVAVQKARYSSRRDVLHTALTAAGFTIEHSQAGLYLWATRGQDCMETVNWFANNGILVAPGSFYGTAGNQHVRVALTATDERIAAAARRLSSL